MGSYRPKLKICGVTCPEDAALVSREGADFCGVLVDVGFSERSLSLPRAREVAAASSVPVVVLLCDAEKDKAREVARQISPHALQLLGRESPGYVTALKALVPCRIWKTVHLPPVSGQAAPVDYVAAGADVLVVDSSDTKDGRTRFGGTGKVADWGAAVALVRSASIAVFLAGGIGPHNVRDALVTVRPVGVDLSTGVEVVRGRKDPEKVKALVANFAAAVAEIERGDR